MKKSTKILHTGNEVDPVTGAVSYPIYQVSTFHQDGLENDGAYEYSRSANPTRNTLENILTKLENGYRAFAFASGMATISSIFLLFSPGDHLLVTSDVYGGTYRALTGLFQRLGIETTFIDTTIPENIERNIKDNTRAIYLESPSNPLLKITNIRQTVQLAQTYNLLTIMDNTFMTPYFQRPLELGIDIVIHSATKYLGGHSDLIIGAACVNCENLASRIKFLQNTFGAIAAPQDCWLLMRGIKTLKVRMEQHQESARALAAWLNEHSYVNEVYYPSLIQNPGHQIHQEQADGDGGIISFRLQSSTKARNMLENVRIPVLATSLGAVESIITYPCTMSHDSIPIDIREQMGIGEDLVRLSVGLEAPEDLIADLEQALK